MFKYRLKNNGGRVEGQATGKGRCQTNEAGSEGKGTTSGEKKLRKQPPRQ